jgi:hypothetical protein
LFIHLLHNQKESYIDPNEYVVCLKNEKQCFNKTYALSFLGSDNFDQIIAGSEDFKAYAKDTPIDFYAYGYNPPNQYVAVCDHSSKKCYTRDFQWAVNGFTMFFSDPNRDVMNMHNYYVNNSPRTMYLTSLSEKPADYELLDSTVTPAPIIKTTRAPPLPFITISPGLIPVAVCNNEEKKCYSKDYVFTGYNGMSDYYDKKNSDPYHQVAFYLSNVMDTPDEYINVDYPISLSHQGVCDPNLKKCYSASFNFSTISPSFRNMRDFYSEYKKKGAFYLNVLKDTPDDYEAVNYLEELLSLYEAVCNTQEKKCYSRQYDFTKFNPRFKNMRDYYLSRKPIGDVMYLSKLSDTPDDYTIVDYTITIPYEAVCSALAKRCWSKNYDFSKLGSYTGMRDYYVKNKQYGSIYLLKLSDTPGDYSTEDYTNFPYEAVCNKTSKECYSRGNLKDYFLQLKNSNTPYLLLDKLSDTTDDYRTMDYSLPFPYEAVCEISTRQCYTKTYDFTKMGSPPYKDARDFYVRLKATNNVKRLTKLSDTPDEYQTMDYVISLPYEGICTISSKQCYSKNYDFSKINPSYKTMRDYYTQTLKSMGISRGSAVFLFLNKLSETPDEYKTVDYTIDLPYEGICSTTLKQCWTKSYQFSVFDPNHRSMRDYYIANKIYGASYLLKLTDTPDDYYGTDYVVDIPYEGICNVSTKECYSKNYDFSKFSSLYRNMKDYYIKNKQNSLLLSKLSDTPDTYKSIDFIVNIPYEAVCNTSFKQCWTKDFNFSVFDPNYRTMRDYYVSNVQNALYLSKLSDTPDTYDTINYTLPLSLPYEALCNKISKKCYTKNFDFKTLNFRDTRQFYIQLNPLVLTNLSDTPDDYQTVDYIVDAPSNAVGVCDSNGKKCYDKTFDFSNINARFRNMRDFYLSDSMKYYLTKLSDTPDDYQTIGYSVDLSLPYIGVCDRSSKTCYGKSYPFSKKDSTISTMSQYYRKNLSYSFLLKTTAEIPDDYYVLDIDIDIPYEAVCNPRDKICYSKDYDFKSMGYSNMRNYYIAFKPYEAFYLTKLTDNIPDEYNTLGFDKPLSQYKAVCIEREGKQFCYCSDIRKKYHEFTMSGLKPKLYKENEVPMNDLNSYDNCVFTFKGDDILYCSAVTMTCGKKGNPIFEQMVNEKSSYYYKKSVSDIMKYRDSPEYKYKIYNRNFSLPFPSSTATERPYYPTDSMVVFSPLSNLSFLKENIQMYANAYDNQYSANELYERRVSDIINDLDSPEYKMISLDGYKLPPPSQNAKKRTYYPEDSMVVFSGRSKRSFLKKNLGEFIIYFSQKYDLDPSSSELQFLNDILAYEKNVSDIYRENDTEYSFVPLDDYILPPPNRPLPTKPIPILPTSTIVSLTPSVSKPSRRFIIEIKNGIPVLRFIDEIKPTPSTTPTPFISSTTPIPFFSTTPTPFVSSTTPIPFVSTTPTPFISSITPFVSSTTPTPFVSSTTPFVSSTTPFVSSTTPTPFISSTTPTLFVSTTPTPFISSITPFVSSTTPTPFVSMTPTPFTVTETITPIPFAVTETITPTPFTVTETITPTPFTVRETITPTSYTSYVKSIYIVGGIVLLCIIFYVFYSKSKTN